MSKIQWTDRVWNPVVGCTRVSAGCEHCYAERVAHRGMQEAHRGLTVVGAKGPRWNGTVRCLSERLEQPLHWRKPVKVFVNSMSDLFHEAVPDEFIDRVFAVMQARLDHTFQVLTKRPERMRSYFEGLGEDADRICEAGEALAAAHGWCHANSSTEWPLRNVWLLVSVEDQETADERIPQLLRTPAAVRGVSYEPALGPVDFEAIQIPCEREGLRFSAIQEQNENRFGSAPALLDWIIVGGESGPGARTCHVEWVRGVVRQCDSAGVPVFVKQMGSHPHFNLHGRETCGQRILNACHLDWRRSAVLKDRKGGDPSEWPEDLRRREFPK